MNEFAAFVPFAHHLAVQQHAQAMRRVAEPSLLVKLGAIRAEPFDVLHMLAVDAAPLKELAAMQHRVFAADLDEQAREVE